MKGLLLKDFYINFSNRRTLVMYIFITLFMGMAMDGEFIIAYASLLFGTMAISTINYDELDNGMAFLMSLPASRRTYVQEKFIYCFCMQIIGLIIGVVVYTVTSLIKGVDPDLITGIPYILGIFIILLVMSAGMIAIELKFGAEKSRIAMFAIYGVVLALGVAVTQIPALNVVFMNILVALKKVSPAVIMGILLAAVLAIIAALYFYSVKVLSDKEF